MTDEPVVALKPVDGVQVYVAPPVAVKVALLPLHIGEGVGAVIVGSGFTAIATVVVFTQPLPSVPVMVYVELIVGLAVTDEPVVALKPVEGVQVYVVPPVAVKMVLLPLHIGAGVGAVIVGGGFTVTATVVVLTQPLPSVPIMVYVELIVGLAVTDEPVVALKPVDGVQVYVIPPVAVKVALLPLQIGV